MAKVMIYGATGYTGRIASKHAKHLGLDVVLAGRAKDSLREFANNLGLPYRVFTLDLEKDIAAALEDVQVLLNCAGPYHRTAKPFITQCLQSGTHYLDIAAELDGYRLSMESDEKAREAGVTLMPGCGGGIVMLGCLANYLMQQVQDPASIDIALHIAGPLSRGTAVSAAENVTPGCLQRVNGLLVEKDSQQLEAFDFADGRGPVSCFPITLPTLLTTWHATGIPNIATFADVSDGDRFPTEDLDSMPPGPTDEEREAYPYHASAVVKVRDGTVKRAALRSVNGYTLSAVAVVEAGKKVLDGEAKPGFRTPAEMFGHGFVVAIADSKFELL